MERHRVSREVLRDMAGLSRLDLGDERLDELVSLVRRTVDDVEGLDSLGLTNVEPAIVFKAKRG